MIQFKCFWKYSTGDNERHERTKLGKEGPICVRTNTRRAQERLKAETAGKSGVRKTS